MLNGSGARRDSINRQDIPALALGWLAVDFRPRLIVLPDLQVLWHNEPAEEQLGEATGVTLRDGALHFASATTQRDFTDFLERLGSGLDTLSIRYADRSAHLLFRGWRIDTAGRGAACLEFTRDTQEFVARYYDIDRVFALTPAEHRVVIGLLDGRTAGQLAAAQTISVDTVRTHVRRVYSKIGVRSREELFSRLRPYRIL